MTVNEFRTLYEGDKTVLKVADIYNASDPKKMLLDFDDLLVEVCQLLNKHEEVN